MGFRVGVGYDVHRLGSHRKLILGGVEVPYKYGLIGHSDADVITHAIIDALLGAAHIGDIGVLFPDTDTRYKDISSLKLLSEVGRLLNNKDYRISNIDSIIIAEAPKLRSYISQMEQNIARALSVSSEIVSVKATTEEGLGFSGKGEGIAAKAICLIVKETGVNSNESL